MTAQQLDVDKLKTDGKLMVESPLGTMWVYSTDTYLGVMVMNRADGPADVRTAVAYIDGVQSPSVALGFNPPDNYFDELPEGTIRHGFALGGSEIQIPHPDNSVTVLTLKELSELVRAARNK